MNYRDEKGRFLPGAPGGPGRPKLAKEVEYLRSMVSVCSVEDWQAITKQAVIDARDGDSRARDWLSRYLLPEGDNRPALEEETEADPMQAILDAAGVG